MEGGILIALSRTYLTFLPGVSSRFSLLFWYKSFLSTFCLNCWNSLKSAKHTDCQWMRSDGLRASVKFNLLLAATGCYCYHYWLLLLLVRCEVQELLLDGKRRQTAADEICTSAGMVVMVILMEAIFEKRIFMGSSLTISCRCTPINICLSPLSHL